MTLPQGLRTALLLLLVVPVGTSWAQTTPEARARCAIRLSAALLGKSPTSTLLSSTDPQANVDAMLTSADFIERFSRFANARMNRDPGDAPAEDATYYLVRHVLQNRLPWREVFVGPYRVDPGASATADALVASDTSGLGYFRSRPWMVRYAGNEIDGYRIVAAYRMMQNTIGLKLSAALNTDGVNATGRLAQPCASCHYNTTFGLDYAANILSKRVGTGAGMTFTAPTAGPQPLLDSTVSDDRQLVTGLVNSTDHRFEACRLATEFLYGRAEFRCEGPVFDRCMAAFSASGTMQSALSAIARDTSFCQ